MPKLTLCEYTIKYWEVVHQWNARDRKRPDACKVYSVMQALNILGDITEHARYRSVLYSKAYILLQDVIENAADSTTVHKYEHRL